MPLSPVLTNPDMILPYQSRSRSSTPPARIPLTPPAMSPFFANQPWESMGQANSTNLSGTRREPLGSYTGNIVKTPRPSLPGAWQTEEDLHAASDTWTNQPSPFKSPSMAFQETTSGSDSTSGESARHYPQELQKKAALHEVVIPGGSRHNSLASNGEPQDLNRLDEPSLDAVDEDESDPFSHAAEILANAKKRLTVSRIAFVPCSVQ